VLETVLDAMKSLTVQDEDQPLHVGEVMACWIYLAGLELAKVSVQTAINTTTDDELKVLLEEDMKLGTSQRKRLHEFMIKEGITLPPAPEDMPISDSNSIPLGVKLTDDVIANELSLKIISLIMKAASATSESIRTDVGFLFIQFQTEKLAFATRLKHLMRKRGWIRIPPFYVPPGSQKPSS
jgi:spore coat protein CotF